MKNEPKTAGRPRHEPAALPLLAGEKLPLINKSFFPEEHKLSGKNSGMMLNSPSRYL